MLRLQKGIVAGLALSPPQFRHAGRWNSASQDRLLFINCAFVKEGEEIETWFG